MYGILLSLLGWCPYYYLDLLDKLQKGICRTIGPSLVFSWLIVKVWPAKVFYVGITLVDVFQNWRNWFHFPFLEGGLLVILIDCMIFLPQSLDVTMMSM